MSNYWVPDTVSLDNHNGKLIIILCCWTTWISREKNRHTQESSRKLKSKFFYQTLHVYLRFSLSFCFVLHFTNQLFLLTNSLYAAKWLPCHLKLYPATFQVQSCFPGGSDVKASACNVGDPGSIPGLGRPPGEGNANPLQHSCLENPMDEGTW